MALHLQWQMTGSSASLSWGWPKPHMSTQYTSCSPLHWMECVEGVPSGQIANHKLLITRAIRLLTAATIRPAHAKPPHPTWVTAVRQIFRCYHPQGKLFFLRACFPQYVTVPVPDGIRDVDVLGFSAESYTGLAIHEVLNEFDCFPGTTKVAAIVSPPEMLRLATGERRVVLLHCLEDRLCVWCPDTLTDLNYIIVLIDGHPSWSGRARHAYGHLLFTQLKKAAFI